MPIGYHRNDMGKAIDGLDKFCLDNVNKRDYISPTLISYGSLADMTLNIGNAGDDGQNAGSREIA
jgi:hypothetical protein